MDLPTRQDLFAIGRRTVITTPNLRINPQVVDIEGSDVNLAIIAMSVIGEEIIARLAACFAEFYVETAFRSDLDRVAYDRYGLTRLPATPARVDLTLTRPAPGVSTPGTVAAGTIVQTASGVQFSTDIAVSFTGFQTTATVSATALVVGPGGNVSAGLITRFVTPPFDATLTVTNGNAAGGAEQESDTAFKGRIRGFFATLRRGTLGAIQYGAIQVPGIAVAKAVEVISQNTGLPAAMVQVIVADASGAATSSMLTAVRDKLLEYRALGIPTQTLAGVLASPLPTVEWDIDFDSGVDTVERSELVRAATVAAAQFLAPGATLYRSSLIAAARTVPGAIVRDTSLRVPVGDVVPVNNTTIIRIRPQDVSFV